MSVLSLSDAPPVVLSVPAALIDVQGVGTREEKGCSGHQPVDETVVETTGVGKCLVVDKEGDPLGW